MRVLAKPIRGRTPKDVFLSLTTLVAALSEGPASVRA
jgi:hypothetical protein